MDNKDLPVQISNDEEIEISNEKRRLLEALSERLSGSDSIKFEKRPGYLQTHPTEITFIMIDIPDKNVDLAIWSTRRLSSEGKDVGRSINVAWIGTNPSELGSIHYEDKRMAGVNHHRPYEGGIVNGINLDTELEIW